ncbi:MAG: transposase [Gemmatimonadetes bacterium]|nr:transposase [Gemmatimonadota bacterium]
MRAKTTSVAAVKTSVVGAVQREGEVRAEVTDDTKGRTVLGFIEQSVETQESSLITDEYKAYINAYKMMPHRVVKHDEGYVDPDDKTLHTNTIEGFWSLLKRAWYGSHHKYTKDWSPLFVAEAVWK